MKVYHFINELYGLEAIQNQRLKASKLSDLNDPFELFSIDLSSSKMFREAMETHKSYLAHKWYILCFSKSWRSPLLWSHYADRHKGMALEFEVPENYCKEINYQKRRIQLVEAKLKNSDETTMKLLTTKYIEWEYEDEVRLFIRPSNTKLEMNLNFYPFNEELKLKSIILAPLSNLNSETIQTKLPKHTSIKVIRSRMAFKEFHIVKNRAYKIERLNSA